MLHIFFAKERQAETTLLFACSLFCFSLSLFRIVYTGSIHYLFLNWNLFLAFLPWALTRILINKPLWIQRTKYLLAIGLLWVLFYPNAPYILTDLFHLRLYSTMPIWFDLVLILSFAWTGLLYGFISLNDMEHLFSSRIDQSFIKFLSAGMLFISAFGIYVGRYLRWNSWDIITKPHAVFSDLAERIIHPFDHPSTWGMTLLMGFILNMFYWSFKLILKR